MHIQKIFNSLKKASVNLKTNFRNKFSKNQQQISDTNHKSLNDIFSRTIANDCGIKLSINSNPSFSIINSNQTEETSFDTQQNSQFISASFGIRSNNEPISSISNKISSQITNCRFNIEPRFAESPATYESEDHEMNE
jgi:wyosine [tRNA(Phe)-imidazoG37] synthetase (radical SAM superfamily)